VVRQFKNQDFSKTQFRGKDTKREMFNADISPEDIEDDVYFECNLVIDRLRDEHRKRNWLSGKYNTDYQVAYRYDETQYSGRS